MKNFRDMKMYFASPWFSPEQAEREDRVKNKLRELGFNIWSPKESCVCSPIADKELREKVFISNCDHIASCDILFAITDGKDMGTIWEAGYARGRSENDVWRDDTMIIVYYCETLGPNGQFNLMLAESGDIVITSFDELNRLPELIQKREGLAYAGIVE